MFFLLSIEEIKSVESFEPARVSILKTSHTLKLKSSRSVFFLLLEHLYSYLVPRGLEKEHQKQEAAAKVPPFYRESLSHCSRLSSRDVQKLSEFF